MLIIHILAESRIREQEGLMKTFHREGSASRIKAVTDKTGKACSNFVLDKSTNIAVKQ